MKLYCYSCANQRITHCDVNRNGFPQIGSACASFDYEPGSGPAEFASWSEYERAAMALGGGSLHNEGSK